MVLNHIHMDINNPHLGGADAGGGCDNSISMTKSKSEAAPPAEPAPELVPGRARNGRKRPGARAQPKGEVEPVSGRKAGESAARKRPAPDAWDREAKRLIKSAMALRGYNYKSLAAALEKAGFGPTTEAAITLRINRASFNMGFALRVLHAMGVKSIDLSHIKGHKPPPKVGGGS
jgi:hypothetical protein